jgi:serine/threonine protein kinase
VSKDRTFPQVFGRYLLLRRLSRGGMGEIFLAKSGQLTGFEKLCVIKKILPELAEDREFIRRFIDEAQVAIKLQHANIAPVFEVGMVDGEYFLALEYLACTSAASGWRPTWRSGSSARWRAGSPTRTAAPTRSAARSTWSTATCRRRT